MHFAHATLTCNRKSEKVHHTTVISWVKQIAGQLPENPETTEIPEITEVDELETLEDARLGPRTWVQKKTKFGYGA